MKLLQTGMDNKVVEKTNLTRKLTIGGRTQILPVYCVRLDQLYYNDKNGRIATWVSKYNSESNDKIDVSNLKVDEFNKIIHKFIEDSGKQELKDTEINIKNFGQQLPGVTLNDGRIIDGNRRFTCLRNLSKIDEKFNYFETVILEVDYDNHAKQIKELELWVQHGEEKKVSYSPIDNLVEIYTTIQEEKLLTIEEYAKKVNEKKAKIKKELMIATLLVEYLDFIKESKKYYLAREEKLDGPLREIPRILSNIKDADEKEDIKEICFMFLHLKPEGDMTRYIRKFKDIVDNPKSKDEFLEKTSPELDAFIASILSKKKQRLDNNQNIFSSNPDSIQKKDDSLGYEFDVNIEDIHPKNETTLRQSEPTEDAEALKKITKNLKNTTDKVTRKLKMTKDRNEADNQVQKCIEIIQGINIDIINILSISEKETLKRSINLLKASISDVENCYNA